MNKIKRIQNTAAYLLTLLLSVGTLSSCVKDTDADSMYLSEYTNSDVKSYGDLFEIFWQVMSQRYCYFNEQTGDYTLDWNQIYKEYKPKFEALKTWNQSLEWTNEEIYADNQLAQEYFKEITSQIRDGHFYVDVILPTAHASYNTYSFLGKQRESSSIPLQYHYADIVRRSDSAQERFLGSVPNEGSYFNIVGTFLKEQPETYYLSFNSFALSQYCTFNFKESYLPNAEKGITISEETMANYAEKANLSQAPDGEKAKEAIKERIQQINKYLTSDEVRNAITHMEAYRSQKNVEGLSKAMQDAFEASPYQEGNNYEGYWATDQEHYSNIRNWSKEASTFIQSVSCEIYEVLNTKLDFNVFIGTLYSYKDNSLTELYATQFLTPLKQGKIKNLILDLRANGGGLAADSYMLTSYLVSHDAVYAATREKEGASPFSYTPWVDQVFKKTEESIGRDIPICILLDVGSASMSEITSLILKSQGSHVTLIGQNSAGAHCVLHEDLSNSGYKANVTSYLKFYMPAIALRTPQGQVLEGIGLTPDVYVEPFTNEEIQHFIDGDQTVTDRALDKAIEVLKNK